MEELHDHYEGAGCWIPSLAGWRLRHRRGQEYDTANILSMLGKSMEKLLTLDKDEFERTARRTRIRYLKKRETPPRPIIFPPWETS